MKQARGGGCALVRDGQLRPLEGARVGVTSLFSVTPPSPRRRRSIALQRSCRTRRSPPSVRAAVGLLDDLVDLGVRIVGVLRPDRRPRQVFAKGDAPPPAHGAAFVSPIAAFHLHAADAARRGPQHRRLRGGGARIPGGKAPRSRRRGAPQGDAPTSSPRNNERRRRRACAPPKLRRASLPASRRRRPPRPRRRRSSRRRRRRAARRRGSSSPTAR